MKRQRLIGALVCAVLLLAADAAAAPGDRAAAVMHNPNGEQVGEVFFTETPGGVLATARLRGLPSGTHAFHVHTRGACTPDFSAAKGHFNPEGRSHGFLSKDGPHAGDFPNFTVPDSGAVTFEAYNDRLRLDGRLLDDDGAAVVIHQGEDDYRTDPAGDAGTRIACGVIQR